MDADEKKIEEVSRKIQQILDENNLTLEFTVQHTPIVRIVKKEEGKK